MRHALIRRGQVVTVIMLVDGDEKAVHCERAPLVDIDVVNEKPGARSRAFVEGFSESLIARNSVIGRLRSR